MLNLGVQVVLDIAQLGLRKARLQSLRTLENGWDIALGIQQQTRTIMRRDGTEGIQQLDHIPGVRLTYGGTGESLEHPLALWRDGGNHRGRNRYHAIGGRHQCQSASQADAESRGREADWH